MSSKSPYLKFPARIQTPKLSNIYFFSLCAFSDANNVGPSQHSFTMDIDISQHQQLNQNGHIGILNGVDSSNAKLYQMTSGQDSTFDANQKDSNGGFMFTHGVDPSSSNQSTVNREISFKPSAVKNTASLPSICKFWLTSLVI